MQLEWGAQAAGLRCLAARQTLRPTILYLIKRCGTIWWNEVFGAPPKTARGPRALPQSTASFRASCPRSQLSHGVNPVLNRGDRRELIFLDDEDRQRFVATLGEACAKTAVDLPKKTKKETKTLMTFASLRFPNPSPAR